MALNKKQIERKVWDAINRQDFDALDELLASEYALIDLASDPEQKYDREEVKGQLAQIAAAIPGGAVEIVAQSTTYEGEVVTRFVYRAPGSDGETLSFQGISISKVQKGQLQYRHVLWEALRAAQELQPPVTPWRWPPWRWPPKPRPRPK